MYLKRIRGRLNGGVTFEKKEAVREKKRKQEQSF